MMLKRYFRTAYFLFLFSAVISGCSQEDFPEKNEPEGVPVRFVLDNSIISNLDTDTEFVPMRRSETEYNNFAAFNAEFAIYRKIEGKYILQKYEYKKQSLTPESINNSTKISLLEKLGLTSSYVLQPGEYRACVGVNVLDYGAPSQYPEIGKEIISIIKEPKIFLSENPIRDVFYTYQDFTVSKATQLDENKLDKNNLNNITFGNSLVRKSSPIRIILMYNYKKDTGDVETIEVVCNLSSPDNSMPIGINIDGNANYADAGNIDWRIERIITLSTKIETAEVDLEPAIFFPNCKDSKTSIFVPYRNDNENLNLNLEITSIKRNGSSTTWTDKLTISNVRVKPNKITNIILKLSDSDNRLTYIEDSDVLNKIKTEWEKRTGTPFDYLEYNEPK